MGSLMTLPNRKLVTKCNLHYSPMPRRNPPMTSQEVNAAIRDSLGLPAKPEPQPTLPQEGHVSEFPYWSFSKKRSSVTRLDITYDDNSFMTLIAPLGMPSP